MTRHTCCTAIVVAVSLLGASSATAQEPVGPSAPQVSTAPGWTFTPAFGYATTYDDNISFFGLETAEGQNDDLLSMYRPSLSADYYGRHLRFGADYGGSLLNYRTFTSLNRWDQRGKIDLRRQETARLQWFARASGALMPSTDMVELGGIPYRHTGARTAEGRAGVEFQIGARDGVTSSFSSQWIEFDRPPEVRGFLRGGTVLESVSAWRHRLGSRLSAGMDYSFRRAAVVGDLEQFSIHTAQSAITYAVSPTWTFSGGGGLVHLERTATTAGRTGPAWSAALDRHNAHSRFHIGYARSFIPSFGFGGTIQSQETAVSYRTALFGSRHWYTDQSVMFRDDTPITSPVDQLPLRSLRTNSVLSWGPQPWVRLELFYSRLQQTSFRAGGQLFRNRVGFQIVTSKPVRVS
jgi:hypothetical protein